MIPDPLLGTVRLAGLGMAKERRHRTGRANPAIGHCVRASLLLTLTWLGIGCDGNNMPMPDPSVRYVAFGDSATAGMSGHDYVDNLPLLLGRPPEEFANQGEGGETTSEGLERLRGLLSMRIYPNAHTLLYWEGGTDIIALMREVDRLLLLAPLASNYPYSRQLNETLDRIQATIEAAVAEGQAAGLAVYVATYFSLREAIAPCDPLFLDIILPSEARNANGYVSLLNDRIRQAAANTGATLVDIASANESLHADDANFRNCNHLSEYGNGIVAQLFAETLGQDEGE
ncbi:MAG: SGNH/GDSL hydrolase family protein [Phycisphaerae bacterium]|nr:SGNH/GDSL hydrolase family protein [Phycisphaerae bacterium]